MERLMWSLFGGVVDLERHGFGDDAQESAAIWRVALCSCMKANLLVRSIDEQVQLAPLGADLGDVDVDRADC